MSSAKTERLVNLTMALLASQRFIKKSEIFRKVAGYSGSQETKERMFERDKDDLRALGIEIEVDSHDPLFEDEPGYRIKPERFQFPIDAFTKEELALMSAALGMWTGSSFDAVASGAQRRLSGSEDSSQAELFVNEIDLSESGLVDLSRALAQRSAVTFAYKKPHHSETETRRVNPLGLSGWQGSWYLVGEDLDRSDIRVFKLSRITSAIEISSKRNSYEVPDDFDIQEYLVMHSKQLVEVRAAVRKGSANIVRRRASSIQSHPSDSYSTEWDLVSYSSETFEEAKREALWFSDVLVVLQPADLRAAVLEELQDAKVRHG